MIEHKVTCLKINGKQTVKLGSGSIKFKNHFKQLGVPFKIYADFECNVKVVKRNDRDKNSSYTKSIKIILLAVLLTKLFVLMTDLVSQLFFIEEKNAVNKFIEAILEEMNYFKKNNKKAF